METIWIGPTKLTRMATQVAVKVPEVFVWATKERVPITQPNQTWRYQSPLMTISDRQYHMATLSGH